MFLSLLQTGSRSVSAHLLDSSEKIQTQLHRYIIISGSSATTAHSVAYFFNIHHSCFSSHRGQHSSLDCPPLRVQIATPPHLRIVGHLRNFPPNYRPKFRQNGVSASSRARVFSRLLFLLFVAKNSSSSSPRPPPRARDDNFVHFKRSSTKSAFIIIAGFPAESEFMLMFANLSKFNLT